jgi:hypothetical protein
VLRHGTKIEYDQGLGHSVPPTYETSKWCGRGKGSYGGCVGVDKLFRGAVALGDTKDLRLPPIITSIEAYEDLCHYLDCVQSGARCKAEREGPLPVLEGGFVCTSHRPDAIAIRINSDFSQTWKCRADPGVERTFSRREVEMFDGGYLPEHQKIAA